MYISYYIRSWILIIFLIPSVLCSIFVLYHFLIDRRFSNAHHHHVIFLVVLLNLFDELTDIIWYIYFYHTGTPLLSTPLFCSIWIFIDFTIYLMVSYLLVWMTIERHILIFNQTWFATQRKRFLVHYFPMILACIYPLVIYIYAFFVQDCKSILNYTKSRCGYNYCVYKSPFLAIWDSIVDHIVPIFTIVIFSATLLVRVLFYRNRARQEIHWRQYRKLLFQLMPISAIYLVLNFPAMILYTAYTAGLPTNVLADLYSLLIFSAYIGILLIPFAAAASLSELKTKCKNLLLFWRRPQQAVAPEIMMVTRVVPRRKAKVAPIS